MSKLLRVMWHLWPITQLGVSNTNRHYWVMIIRHQSSSQFVCQDDSECFTGPGWHRLSVTGTSSRYFLCDANVWDTCEGVWPRVSRVSRGRVMQTAWHPPTVSGGSQEASCKFIFMFLLPAPPCLARSDARNVPRDLGNLMDLLPGLEPSEFSSSLH